MAKRLVQISGGQVKFVYSDQLAAGLASIGSSVSLERASHIEPDGADAFLVDLTPSGGRIYRGFATRKAAEEFELGWLAKTGL
jgi:hypothetical protein